MFCIVSKPCFADDVCDEVPEDEEEQAEFYGMYPFCENIDAPLDEGVPYLVVAGIILGLVFRRQHQKNIEPKQVS